MIDILSRKSHSGDLCIKLAQQHLGNNEWGLAKQAVEEGLSRGYLSEPGQAFHLRDDIYQRLGINCVAQRAGGEV